jgi:hypothetical protein
MSFELFLFAAWMVIVVTGVIFGGTFLAYGVEQRDSAESQRPAHLAAVVPVADRATTADVEGESERAAA